MNQWIYKWEKVLVSSVIICAVANTLDKEDDMIAILLNSLSYGILK
jgi:hypothetical protein